VISSMPSINVIAPGFLTTVQDVGRQGYAHIGVSASGAADPVSLRLGNLLVGNPARSAALEMILVGGSFAFESACRIALTGSDFGATLDGHDLPLWQSVPVAAGQVLRCGSTKGGARCYLCIQGGVDVPVVLGSASTHIATSLGGFKGRALKAGDVLPVNEPPANLPSDSWRIKPDVLGQLAFRKTLRVTAGPQIDLFPNEVHSLFTSSQYHVTEEADRMGLRLSGPPLKQRGTHDIVTEGVPLGAIQVPRDGEPIILFVEHQTTGGYPKIATVISADIHSVGQLRPRDGVSFEFVTVEQAVGFRTRLEALMTPVSLEAI
jgi:antagonist of KipI